MFEQRSKKLYSRTTKSIPLLQPEHGFCHQNRPERGQVQDWYPNEKREMVVSVCLNGRCCSSMCDDDDELFLQDDWPRKAFSLISSRDDCQRSSPSRSSNTPRAGFKPSQNLSSGLVEWSCAVVITATYCIVLTKMKAMSLCLF